MGSIDAAELPATNTSSITSALAAAQEAYTTAHPRSRKSHQDACKYMPGGNTRTVLHTSPFPLTIHSAQSCYLTTADGHQYVDFLGEYTAGIYGHNSPIIRTAVEKALDGGWNYGAHSQSEQELARILCSRFAGIELVRFVNSGTEANMMALATAIAVAKQYGDHKKGVLLFEKGYHGSTISGRAPSGKPSINLPHDFIVGQYNDVEGVKRLVSSIPEDSLAAILVEPMLGSGGCFAATNEFLQTLRDLATQHRAILIFDEVMTSRLSYHGFGSIYGVLPDLTTLGKYLGGGMSFGAFGGRADLMSLYDPRQGQLEHPGTFNNNVFTMQAGIAGASILTPERLHALNSLGDLMRLEVEKLLAHHLPSGFGIVPSAPLTDSSPHDPTKAHPRRPPKMFIKGVGSLMCVHFAGPNRESLQGLFWHHMLEHGIYMAQRGFIALSIEITDAHVSQFVAGVESFLRQWSSILRW
ncbi:hypothetical protein LTS08_006446 [Lithohypha guttulata]|nr:hypothetical protein LTS08_006446 [Lithohypha guttulata]